MKREGIFWVDKDGNKWSKDQYTKNVAQRLSRTMSNCTGCVNCSSCCSCTYCDNCQQCHHCYNCKMCKNCEFSDHLQYCCEVRYSHSCKKTMFAHCCWGISGCARVAFVRKFKGCTEMQAAFNGLIGGKEVQMVLCKDDIIRCVCDNTRELSVRDLISYLWKNADQSMDVVDVVYSLADALRGAVGKNETRKS